MTEAARPLAPTPVAETTVVQWFDVAQDNPSLVLAQVRYTSGATPEEWTLEWFIFPGFQRAGPSHPSTRFDFTATSTPPEPPACEYIETHTVTKIPGLAKMPAVHRKGSVIEEIDDGSYGLFNAATTPVNMGWIEVTQGASPMEMLEMWYITNPAYEPLGPSTSNLVDVLDYDPNVQPGTPLYTLQQQVVRSFPS